MRYHIKNIIRIALCTAAASQLLQFSSCAREDFDWLVGTPISVVATTDGETRAGADANIQTSSFKAGETINAYYYHVSGGVTTAIGKTPTTLTASAPSDGKNVLTPDVQPYYPQSGTVNINALYPTTVNVNSTSFEVKDDQTTEANYKLSDLMWAGISGQGKTTSDVNLQFSHQMAKMAITVTGTEGVLIQEVRLINTIRTIGITASSRTIGALGTESNAEKKKILVAKTDETYTAGTSGGSEQLTGAALFPPQPIVGNFIEVVTNFGKTYFSTVDKTFAAAHQYQVDLTITRQQIGFTTTITDWTSDGGSIAVPPNSNAGLKVTTIDPQDYTGSEIKITPLVITYTPNSGDPITLEENKDFETEYFNNINVGTATIIISGKYNENRDEALRNVIRQLKAMTSFEIRSATGQLSYPSATKTVEYEYYTTVDHQLDTHNGDGTITFKSSDENVATVSERGRVTIRNAGSTKIEADMAADGNYSAAHAEYTLTVTPRSIKSGLTRLDAENNKEISITLPYSDNRVTYNGTAFRPQVVITDKGRILQENTHYTVAYYKNTNAGTAIVSIHGKGNYSNAATDSTAVSFTIDRVTPTIKLDTDPISLPVSFTAVRRATTNYGTVTYSSTNAELATYIDGVVKGVSVTNGVTVKATVVGGDGYNWNQVSQEITVKVVQSSWTYFYTGKVQKWTCPLTGVYRLDALGAQGGTYGGFVGGRGAHIGGQLMVQEGQVLYIYVGQAGQTVQTSSAAQGGWNGGGLYKGTNTSATTERVYCGGGGATDFALQGTENSTDWNTTAHLNSRILVAGGGGGALSRIYPSDTKYKFVGGGGSGGAYSGETGYGGDSPGGGGKIDAAGGIASGGSQAVAAGFGYGGNYSGTLSAGMGGGGWYGGASGAYIAANENPSSNKFSRGGSGGGGSSYIWNSANATYYNGHGTNNAPSIPPGSKMTTATQFYITPTTLTAGARPGNGEARIQYMAEDE